MDPLDKNERGPVLRPIALRLALGVLTLLLIGCSSPKAATPTTSTPAIAAKETPKPGTTPAPTVGAAPGPNRQEARVARVIDGDTIELASGQRVRYIGINTPELNDSRSTVRAWAEKGKEKNRELVEGKTVTLERDVSETDQYGRLLRYVYVNGLMVNSELVKLGYAYAVSYPPDVKQQSLFSQLAREAQAAGRGLWGE
ncbi:MAG: thermonuclease family protein [Dehalococcoidia bacterium]|nr:thermonuclease family protein [Dehalococcoidia bacterium]